MQPKIHIFESKCRISGRWNPFLGHFSIWNLKRNPKSNCFCSSSLKCQFLITITQVTYSEWMLFATEISLNIWDVFTNCNGKQHDQVYFQYLHAMVPSCFLFLFDKCCLFLQEPQNLTWDSAFLFSNSFPASKCSYLFLFRIYVITFTHHMSLLFLEEFQSQYPSKLFL